MTAENEKRSDWKCQLCGFVNSAIFSSCEQCLAERERCQVEMAARMTEARSAERELCINIAAQLREHIDARLTLLHQRAVDAAVAAERERCAKVCEQVGEDYDSWDDNRTADVKFGCDLCTVAIRKGGEG